MASSSSAKASVKGSILQKSGKKSKRKLEYSEENNSEDANSLPTTSGNLLSLFAKAKPPEYVLCPVCGSKVELSFINQHLDRGCLTIEHETVLSRSASTTSTVGPSQLSRKVADLKQCLKDKQKRNNLSWKYRSHEIYKPQATTDSKPIELSDDSGSENSCHILNSHSWVNNKDDCSEEIIEVSDESQDRSHDSNVHHQAYDGDKLCNVGRRGEISKEEINRVDESHDPKPKIRKSLSLRERQNAKIKKEANLSFRSSGHHHKNSSDSLLNIRPKLQEKNDVERSRSTPYLKRVQDSPPSVTVSVNKKMKLQISRGSKLSRSRKRDIQNRKSLETSSPSSSVSAVNHEVSTLSDISGNQSDAPFQRYQSGVSEDTNQNGRKSCSEQVSGSSIDTTIRLGDDLSQIQETGISSGSDASQEKDEHQNNSDLSPIASQRSTDSSPTKSPHKPKEPYFVSNFKFVLNAVLGNEDDRCLLSEEDLNTVGLFNELSDKAQQLYIRIFQRKLAWLRVSKIQYPKISDDLAPVAKEVCGKGLFLTENEMTDLEEILRQLPAPEIKLLAKDLKVNCVEGSQKSNLVMACMQHCKKQRGLFGSSLQPVMLKKAKQYLGPCIKLCKKHRAVFSRICLLFSPVLMTDDEENASGGQNQLQALLLVNFGRVTYPAYKINRTRKTFRDREDLIRYETSLQYEHDILAALSTNDFELASHLWQSAKTTQQELLQTKAVEELKSALMSCEFRKDSRGSRWDRLALNLDQHLKDPNQALDAILEGLADKHVKTGHRLSLELRAEKILNAPSNKKLARRRREEFNLNPVTVKDLPSITIQGQILPYTGPGVKNVFFRLGCPDQEEEGVDLCSVEQVALDYYLANGFTHGKHGEGTTFSTLIFLLFWDEIFMDIPDVFSYPYQSGPLDLRTDDFFSNREEALKKKLDHLKKADEETLQGWLEETWNEHEGEACAGVSWDLLTLDEAKSLLGCMGGEFISATAERLLRSHRHCRGGMPDLVVWNTHTKRFKMSEVKGPGDRLSHKQILWIQYFISIAQDAEVCHVEGIQSKHLKHGHRSLLKKSTKKSPRTPRKSPKKSPSKSALKKTPVKLKQKTP
ncbi:Fanconi-associated nuclease 1 [Holothuria leucospilota]|uniref:Fanconi-associated nuclease n=1 Tax=Holothuria leucospilota TaxID=206669 RepID=A0A9Q1BM90_HOLLE|nr:Fanconi-associated nuclease 1 [Holothuria leucospilota]